MTENELYDWYIADVRHEEMLIEREENMNRKVINLKDIYYEDLVDLERLGILNDYIWKDDKLIPLEMIEGE